MALSDRQHDAFDNPAKALCRDGNLRILREAAHLLWEDALTPSPSPGGRGEKYARPLSRRERGENAHAL
jgi:hypothetical protein